MRHLHFTAEAKLTRMSVIVQALKRRYRSGASRHEEKKEGWGAKAVSTSRAAGRTGQRARASGFLPSTYGNGKPATRFVYKKNVSASLELLSAP